MGQFAVIFVLSSLFLGGVLIYNARSSTSEAEAETTAYHGDRLAREVAQVGLEETKRKLAADVDGWAVWTSSPTAVQTQYGSTGTHEDGAYTVTIDNMTIVPPPLPNSGPVTVSDKVWVTSTATYNVWNPDANAFRDTQFIIKATYEKGYTDRGLPPAMRDAIVSDETIDIRGNVQISGGVHTNGELTSSGGTFDVYGTGTYTGSESANDGRFQGGVAYQDSVIIDPVTIPPAAWSYRTSPAPAAYSLSPATDPTGTPPQLISAGWDPVPTDATPTVTGKGTSTDPYILYVNGNLTIDGDVRLRGFTRIYVNGTVTVNGNAALAPVLGTLPDPNQDVTSAGTWAETNLPNGSMTGIYAIGDITLSGTCFVAASLWTRGAVRYTGGGHKLLVGGITAHDPLDIRGNAKIYYTQASRSIWDPGSNLYVPEGLRLIAYREWAQRP